MSALPAAALRAVRAPSTVLRAPAAPVARAAARPGRKQGLTVCRARARAAPAPVPAPALAPIVTVATGPLAGWPLLPPPLPPLPTPLVTGAVLLLALLLFRPWRKSGSVEGLVSRGVGLAEERGVSDDKFYKGMMDGVRTSATPELSDEAIEAARARRRANNVVDKRGSEELEATAVPSNHPWATSKNRLTPEEEAAKRAEVMRLNRTRRGQGAAEE